MYPHAVVQKLCCGFENQVRKLSVETEFGKRRLQPVYVGVAAGKEMYLTHVYPKSK